MKKFLLSVIGMLFMTGITFAQQSQKSDTSCSNLYGKNYWHVSAELNPVALKTTYIGEELTNESVSIKMTGVSLGFTTGIRMMKTQPLYLEVGAKLLYAFKNKDEYDDDSYANYINRDYLETKESLFSLNIPIVATWQFEVVPKVCIAPYLGLNMRYNISGKTKDIYHDYEVRRIWDVITQRYYYERYENNTETTESNWFKSSVGNCNRFNVGLTFGANFTFNRFILGLGYTKDLTEFTQTPGLQANIEYFTISAGCRF